MWVTRNEKWVSDLELRAEARNLEEGYLWSGFHFSCRSTVTLSCGPCRICRPAAGASQIWVGLGCTHGAGPSSEEGSAVPVEWARRSRAEWAWSRGAPPRPA